MTTAYFTFGRFQGLTIGHEYLIKKLGKEATKANVKAFVVISESHDEKRNPLTYEFKAKHLKPIAEANNCVILEGCPKPVNYLTILQHLTNQGYTDFKIFVGEDRVQEIDERVQRYVGRQVTNLDLRTVNEAKVISVGNRNGLDDGIIGASGTKMRQLASESNLVLFKKNIPVCLQEHAEEIMSAMRKGMGLYDTAPPGMEAFVESAKKQMDRQRAYQIAWQIHDDKQNNKVKSSVINQLFGDTL